MYALKSKGMKVGLHVCKCEGDSNSEGVEIVRVDELNIWGHPTIEMGSA